MNKNNVEMSIVLDMHNMPEKERKEILEKLQHYSKNIKELQKQQNNQDNQHKKLFAVQEGTVVGNIYKDNFRIIENSGKKNRL